MSEDKRLKYFRGACFILKANPSFKVLWINLFFLFFN